jgi:hypothetical protein
MKLMLFAMTYWHDEADSHRFDNRWCSYERWFERVWHFFKPIHIFLASGTWSDPRFNRLPGVPLINSGAMYDAPYDWTRRQYACCAMTAAMAYALNRDDWEYLVTFDTDALVGDVNLPLLFSEFSQRTETVMCPAWNKGISGPFMAWKRRGASTMLHHRLHPNLCDPDEPARPEIPEDEWFKMYHGGRWWNPWPQFRGLDLRGMPDDLFGQRWPFVTQVGDEVALAFEKNITPLAVPLT